ncbi:hypothetical protein [Reinekea thalattae]|uniref:Sel1 repeat family protein n=1 Tax=Reinekea thalattae TaxID=2593301 RepID=A0A5C8ZB72_9GAMM|nr:hypothetical protein [Reinekea thalattae]TXR54438.1 hypothetical protein FME95_07860 [Reinekea thalattae]
MTIVKKMTISVVTIALVGFLGVFGYELYLRIPTDTELQIAEGPNKAIVNLIALAEEGVPINDDPYAASTYRPGDPLYEAVAYIQVKRWSVAEEKLKVLADQGNADAMFWLGQINYSGALTGLVGAGWFVRAAKLGNPYAAMMLDENNYECQENMAYYCDKKWGELGRKILIERAAQGDAKAGYALFLDQKYLYKERNLFFDKGYEVKEDDPFQILLKAANDGIKQHYYRPLLKLATLYRNRTSIELFNMDKVPLSPLEEANLFKVVEIAANNNDARAMLWVNYDAERYPEGYPEATMERLIPFSDSRKVLTIYEYYSKKAREDRRYAVQGMARAIAYDNTSLSSRSYQGIFDQFYLEDNGLDPISEAELAQAKELAKEYTLQQSQPIIYIDENVPSLFTLTDND